MTLRHATSDDIPAIMVIERQPGYEALVGQWSAGQHRQHIADPAFLYLVAEDEATRITAFAALHRSADGLLLNRFIVKTAGLGLGRSLLPQVLDISAPAGTGQRVWLRVSSPLPDDARSQRLAAMLGFVLFDDGMAPESVAGVQQALANIGYQIGVTGALDDAAQCVVRAFQRRFRQDQIDGALDLRHG